MHVDSVVCVCLLAACQWQWTQCVYRRLASLLAFSGGLVPGGGGGTRVACVRMADDVLQVVMALTALMSLAFLCFIACIMAFGIWMLKNVMPVTSHCVSVTSKSFVARTCSKVCLFVSIVPFHPYVASFARLSSIFVHSVCVTLVHLPPPSHSHPPTFSVSFSAVDRFSLGLKVEAFPFVCNLCGNKVYKSFLTKGLRRVQH